MPFTRRDLLQIGTAAAVSPWIASIESIARQERRFRFVHFSDLHIQPELGATQGVAMAVKKVLDLNPRPSFIVTGGDHVMDLLSVTRGRADEQFKDLHEALKPLEMPIHGVIGNHDVFGWGGKVVLQSDAMYGKKMVEEKFLGQRAFRSFAFSGWHFTLLDSVQPDPKTGWKGAIDQAQLEWLDTDLAKAGDMPKIVVSHVPVMTLFSQYTEGTTTAPSNTLILENGREVQKLCYKHKVRAVLQGHTHVVEDCNYLDTQYITGGAVCGDWWKGWRLGVHPEGFMVYDIIGNQLSAKYVQYGWNAKVHQTSAKG
ncbi:MAG: metallophosphoesterase [Fimbriimonas sp.]|nr:metallophosphoesterase [Fimbriimonas sp.]